ncbi:RNA polymerase sigma factor [Cohnella silvisoli]|uniref:RNA polymerase sigma factor n=1 Tax=Cohnella silvisoli TaxID=2873699 RepID=A0ABV1KX54_9BACL|nr:RNA polymerase sigma factor [Cohnella silvisoli]MCD9023625.1 RNA polymerase sigma factor [Cohnella silvisoli]
MDASTQPPNVRTEQDIKAWLSELRPDLLRYSRSLCGNRVEAEDIVQDVFVKVMSRLEEDPKHNLNRSYLFRAAKNVWIDLCRRRQRSPQVSLEEMQHDPSSYDHPFYSTRELLEALFDRLMPKPFVILLLCDVFGFTAKETAIHIEGTEGSVQVALSRARSRLQQLARRGDAAEGSRREAPQQQPKTAESVDLLDAVIKAFRRHDPHMIYQAYSRLFLSGSRINDIKSLGGRLCFTFRDPDGNVLMVSG